MNDATRIGEIEMTMISGGRRVTAWIAAFGVVAALWPVGVASAVEPVPGRFMHQGRLLDSEQRPVNGQHLLSFRIYAELSGGTALWSEDVVAEFSNGYYTVALGAENPVDEALLESGTAYLSMAIDDGPEFEPRHRLVSVPYAIVANTARSVEGGPVDATSVAIAGAPVIDEGGNWVGPPIPGDGDLLAALGCSAGQLAVYDGTSWTCQAMVDEAQVEAWVTDGELDLNPATTLDGAGLATVDDLDSIEWAAVQNVPMLIKGLEGILCGDGEMPAWDALSELWACVPPAPDSDLLAALSCAAGNVAKWDGTAWQCAPDDTGGGSALTEADVENWIVNDGIDLHVATTIGGQAILTAADLAFDSLAGVPAGLSDGDDDTLAATVCGAGQILSYDGAAWVCTDDIDTDTLAATVCGTGQILSFDGAAWVCTDDIDTDTDTLAATVCGTGQILSYDGAAWVCTDDIDTDTDTLAATVCGTGQILSYDGAAWVCTDDIDTDTDTLAATVCGTGQILSFDGAAWVCADDADADTLATTACAVGQVLAFNGSVWSCADDADSNTDVLGGLPCSATDIPRFNGSAWTCSADQNTDVLAGMDCQDGELAKFNGTSWVCGVDADADLLATLTCGAGELAKWNGGAWACAADDDADSLGVLTCNAGHVPRFNGSAWSCSADADTLAGLGCLAGQIARFDGSGWDCATPPSDTLSGLGCSGGQLAKWNGSAWICANDADQDTLGTLGCAPGQLPVVSGGIWVCGNDADVLGGLACPDGQVVKRVGGAWACGSDDDADVLGGLPCADGEVAKWSDAAGAWQCAVDADTFTTQVCPDGNVLKYDAASTSWSCATDNGTGGSSLSEAEVETYITNDPIDLFSGSTMGGAPLSTGPHTTSLGWAAVTSKPAGFADDVDDDTLVALGCTPGQVAKMGGAAWTCDVDIDTDTLAALGCTGDGQMPKWDLGTSQWVCGVDVDTDTLAGLGCGADAVPKFVGGTWTCGVDNDADTLAGLGCGVGEVLKFAGGIWGCAPDDDSDTLAGLTCANGAVAKVSNGSWSCGVDVDQDTLGGLTCGNGDIVKLSGGSWDCAPDTDSDTLSGLSCGTGQIPKYNGSTWLCAADENDNTDTLAGLNCPDGQIPKRSGGVWVCDVDANDDTVGALNCAAGHVPKRNASGVWVCAADLDTNAGTLCAVDEYLDGDGVCTNIVTTIQANAFDTKGELTALLDGDYVDEGQANSISNGMLTDDSVGAAEIVNGSVGAAEIDGTEVQVRVVGTCNGGQLMTGVAADGTVTCATVADTNAGTLCAVDEYLDGDGVCTNIVTTIQANAFDTKGELTALLDGDYVDEGQADSISSGMLTDDSVGAAEIVNGSVGAAEIDGAEVQVRVVGTCNGGQLMTGVAADGTVTCATATDTNAGTLCAVDEYLDGDGVCTNIVTTIQANAFDTKGELTALLDGDYVDEGQANSISNGMLTDDSVGAAEIVNGSVGAAEIDGTEVQVRVVGTCNGGQLMTGVAADGTVTCATVADTNAGTLCAVDEYLDGDGVCTNIVTTIQANAFDTKGELTALLDGDYVDEGQANSISNGMLTDDSVGAAEIVNGSVGAAEIDGAEVQVRVVGTCNGGQLMTGVAADGTVTCATVTDTNAGTLCAVDEYLDGDGVCTNIVTTIQANAFDTKGELTALLDGDYVDEGQANSISNGMLTDDSVGAAEIVNGSVGAAEIDGAEVQVRVVGTCNGGQLMTGVAADGTVTCATVTDTNAGTLCAVDEYLDGDGVCTNIVTTIQANAFDTKGELTALLDGDYVDEGQANSISNGMLTDDSVGAAEIVNGSVGAAEIDGAEVQVRVVGTCNGGQLMTGVAADGTVTCATVTDTNAGTLCAVDEYLDGDGVCTNIVTTIQANAFDTKGELTALLDGDYVDEGQANSISNGMLTDDSVGAAEIVNGSVGAAEIDGAEVQVRVVGTCNGGQLMTGVAADGTVTCATVTDTNAGTLCAVDEYLDGDGVCTNIVTTIQANAFDTKGELTALLDGDYVDEGQANSISNGMLTDDSVGAAEIVNGSVGAAEIDGAEVQVRVVGTCNGGQLMTGVAADGTVTCATVADTNAGTLCAVDEYLDGDGVCTNIVTTIQANAFDTKGELTALLDGDYVDEGQANSISNGMLTDDSVGAAEIVNGSVGAAEIDGAEVQVRVVGTCNGGQLMTGVAADGTVTCATVADTNAGTLCAVDEYLDGDGVCTNIVTTIQANAFDTKGELTALLDGDYVDEGQANSISNGMLTDDSVGAAEIVNGSVGAAEIDGAEVQVRVVGTCNGGQLMTGVAADGTVTCATATDTDTLADLGCSGTGQLPKWDATNSQWVCGTDIDSDTLAGLNCNTTQVPKRNAAGTWICASDTNTDTLAGLGCNSGADNYHTGAEPNGEGQWTCVSNLGVMKIWPSSQMPPTNWVRCDGKAYPGGPWAGQPTPNLSPQVEGFVYIIRYQ